MRFIRFVRKKIISLSPLWIYGVVGNSMLPTYRPGEVVFVLRSTNSVKNNTIVIVEHPHTKRLLLKRIKHVKKGFFFVVGDNEQESTDSRTFGWIKKKNILGKVIFKL